MNKEDIKAKKQDSLYLLIMVPPTWHYQRQFAGCRVVCAATPSSPSLSSASSSGSLLGRRTYKRMVLHKTFWRPKNMGFSTKIFQRQTWKQNIQNITKALKRKMSRDHVDHVVSCWLFTVHRTIHRGWGHDGIQWRQKCYRRFKSRLPHLGTTLRQLVDRGRVRRSANKTPTTCRTLDGSRT